MKILMLTPQLPYPANSGGLIKTQNIIQFLAKQHELELACFLKGHDAQHLNDYQAQMLPVKVHGQPINIARTGLNFLRSIVARIPLTVFRNRSSSFAELVKRLCTDKDVLFLDHYVMFQYVPKDFNGRVVVHQQNAEFVMWWRKSQLEQRWLLKQVIAFEAWRIKCFELTMCAKADAVLATCSDEQALIDAGAKADNFFETFHCGETDYQNLPAIRFEQTQPKIIFVGTLSWDANLDGLLWFGETIWPLLKSKMPNIGLTVVGKSPPGVAQRLAAVLPGAEIVGFVDDLDELYRTHRVMIAPLRFGSGVKIKVVNSLLRGLPTVTTDVGAEGLKIENGEHMFVANEPSEFADAVLKLMDSESLWQRFSEQSRQWIEANYSYEQECKNLQRSLGL